MGALMNLSLSMPVIVGWGAWLTAGLVLLIWTRHAREAELQAHALRSVARPLPTKPRSARPASAPVDAFGELQAMLEPEPDLSVARRPGD
jgi:hypothetical protein